MSTPVLYVFTHSVWSVAPTLALTELGYAPDAFEIKQVNLLAGENFAPDFVKINPEASLPTLVADGKTYTNSTDVVAYLVKNAPKPLSSKPTTDILTVIHQEPIDPNFPLLAARTPEELKAKSGDIPGLFVRGRQAALEKYAPTAPEELAGFYKQKLGFNGFLSSVYAPDASEATVTPWFHKSKEAWAAINEFILTKLPTYVVGGKFISGTDAPGEEDFHVAAWLGRIVLLTGGDKSATGLNSLEKGLGAPVPDDVKAYWKNWSERESWAKAYAEGLH